MFINNMKICLAAYNTRLASLFDNATQLKLYIKEGAMAVSYPQIGNKVVAKVIDMKGDELLS